MAKVLYSVSMSLDGFIAGPGGDMSWLVPYLGPNPVVDDLVGRIGALVVGRRTFGGDDPHRGTAKEGKFAGSDEWSGPQWVLTHQAPATPVPGVTFTADLDAAVAAAKAAAGDRYVNVLGADVARQCLAAGLVDEVFVCVVPVLLGDGVRLFHHSGGSTVRLTRIGQSEAPLATNIWYRVD
jgi:dihydrofolate reductase